jgi:5'-nucleotidase
VHLRHPISFLAAICLVVSCAAPRQVAPVPAVQGQDAPAAPVRLTLVGTNDLHGWLEPHRTTLADGSIAEQGGLAVFAGYLKALRAVDPEGVLLLDGGDLFQGTLASNLTEGAVVVEAMNALGYTAAALGNHEFDYGPSGPVSVARPGDDPFGALKDRLKQLRFPLLGANLYDATTGARPGWLGNDGTLLIERKGVKVGLVGLSTPSTPHTTNPVNVESLRFGSLAPTALEAATRLRKHGAEVVIAVVHAGGKCASMEDPRDVSSCDQADSELFEMMEGLPEGTLDAVIAGHTHSPLGHFIRGTPVIETSGLGRSFGLIELALDPQTRKLLPEETRITSGIPVCSRVEVGTKTCDSRALRRMQTVAWEPARFRDQAIERNEAIAAMLAPALARVAEEQQRPLGLQVPALLGRDYQAESPLGNLLADAVRSAAGADLAILNSGGLRADLPAGELTFGGIYEVIPFDNTLAVVKVTTPQLRKLLQAAYGGHKGVFQLSGLAVRLAPCPGAGRLLEVSLPNGKPLPAQRTWKVAMPDFLARGGDGLGAVLKTLPEGSVDLGDRSGVGLREALIAHWQASGRPLVAPASGRIRLAPGDASACRSKSAEGH